MARIIGLDIGMSATGWCVFNHGYPVEVGEIKPPSNKVKKKRRLIQMDEDSESCRIIARLFSDLILRVKPHAIIGELPHGGSQSARAGRCMGMATGIVIGVAESMEVPAFFVTPDEVKAITNRFKATKNHVAKEVARRFPSQADLFEGVSDHITDAAAAYIAGSTHPSIRVLERQ